MPTRKRNRFAGNADKWTSARNLTSTRWGSRLCALDHLHASPSRLRRDIVEFRFHLCRFIYTCLDSECNFLCTFFSLFLNKIFNLNYKTYHSSIFLDFIVFYNWSRKLITVLAYFSTYKKKFILSLHLLNIIYSHSSQNGPLAVWHFTFDYLIPRVRVTRLTLYLESLLFIFIVLKETLFVRHYM